MTGPVQARGSDSDMTRSRLAVWVGGAGLAFTALACGGGGGSSPAPTAPTPPSGGGGGGSTAPMSITITVTGSGVTASGNALAPGGTITWVNNDNVAHDMSSDPHPQHTDCPGMGVGDLNPNQSRTSGAITSVRNCGFHDHLNPGTQALTGQIAVR